MDRSRQEPVRHQSHLIAAIIASSGSLAQVAIYLKKLHWVVQTLEPKTRTIPGPI